MNQKEIDLVFSSGKYFKNKLFSGKYVKSDTFKCAVTPTKKIFKLSVDRNRVKRRVFSAISHIYPLPAISITIIPNKETISADFKDLSSALKDFLI